MVADPSIISLDNLPRLDLLDVEVRPRKGTEKQETSRTVSKGRKLLKKMNEQRKIEKTFIGFEESITKLKLLKVHQKPRRSESLNQNRSLGERNLLAEDSPAKDARVPLKADDLQKYITFFDPHKNLRARGLDAHPPHEKELEIAEKEDQERSVIHIQRLMEAELHTVFSGLKLESQ